MTTMSARIFIFFLRVNMRERVQRENEEYVFILPYGGNYT